MVHVQVHAARLYRYQVRIVLFRVRQISVQAAHLSFVHLQVCHLISGTRVLLHNVLVFPLPAHIQLLFLAAVAQAAAVRL